VTILFVLVPLGLVLCLLAVGAFFWAVNAGQFEDLDAAAVSPLEDDRQDALEDGLAPDSGGPFPAPSAPGGPPSG